MKCLLLVLYLYFAKVDANQKGCQGDIRLFGPNNQYKCNCKDLSSCNFANNSNCQNAECRPYFGGTYCQKVLYHQQLKDQASEDSNIFKNIMTKVESDFTIKLTNVKRVNQIRITCNDPGKILSIDIGKTRFCDMSCSRTAKCIGDTGDITEKTLSIKLQGEIEVSNMEITGCSPFWFGENCDMQCHCANNSDCHQISGNCPLGCERGRSRTDCQKLNYENVALNQRTDQSSTLIKDIILANGICKEQVFPFAAKMAVDGNIDQKQERGSCMRTTKDLHSYWEVYFGKAYSISNIRIYNTDSKDSDDLIGFYVYVGSKLCRTLSEDIVKASKIIDITCTKVLQGHSVKIESNLREYKALHICEVEVLQCLPGFYGYRCSNRCHQCKNSYCDQHSGRCLSGCAPRYKQHPNKTCTAKALEDDIWDEQYSVSSEITEVCNKNMRLFGPNDTYQCHCKELSSCDFKNNGKCKEGKCLRHYAGPFCQQILYHKYLEKRVSEEQNVFTNKRQWIYNHLDITFKHKYRINLIKINSTYNGKMVLFIGSTKFCDLMYPNMTQCKGDAIGKRLIIDTAYPYYLSNMKVSGCSRFWFGENCDKQCHCAKNMDCHQITGNCPLGCESGRSGADCQTLNYENVAINKKASQSSTYYLSTILQNNTCKYMPFNYSANLAVDGNIDQQHERLSCMHTIKQFNPEWTVDLREEYNISWIRIYNRNNNVWQLNKTNIHVDGELCYSIQNATEIVDINCNKVIQGKTVTISKTTRGILHFCEVEVLQCVTGFYGEKCSKNCPECRDLSCDQWSGKCRSGCAPGYKRNDNKCTACDDGSFGEGCSMTCNCKDNYKCNKGNGNCGSVGCELGYKGDNCLEPCDYGTFGEGCSMTCHCKDNNNCHKTDGICGLYGCEPGYLGDNCQQSCDDGSFGEGCSMTCNCKDNYKCNKGNGNCGSVGCELGYKGDNCLEPCSVDTFGDRCSQTCHCKNNTNCDRKIGICGAEGCEKGYKGLNCQESNVTIIIIITVSVLLLVLMLSALIYYKFKLSKASERNIFRRAPTIPAGTETEIIQDDRLKMSKGAEGNKSRRAPNLPAGTKIKPIRDDRLKMSKGAEGNKSRRAPNLPAGTKIEPIRAADRRKNVFPRKYVAMKSNENLKERTDADDYCYENVENVYTTIIDDCIPT